MFRVVFCLLLLLGGALPTSRAESPPSAAACVIRHQQGILLVQDRLSRAQPERRLHRQGRPRSRRPCARLFEETGLQGRVTGELALATGRRAFACQTLEPLRVQRGRGLSP
jgi:hypothetical protein